MAMVPERKLRWRNSRRSTMGSLSVSSQITNTTREIVETMASATIVGEACLWLGRVPDRGRRTGGRRGDGQPRERRRHGGAVVVAELCVRQQRADAHQQRGAGEAGRLRYWRPRRSALKRRADHGAGE